MDDVKDSNGNILKDGDSVHVIKDLKVKGAGETLKRGTLIKNIRLGLIAESEDESLADSEASEELVGGDVLFAHRVFIRRATREDAEHQDFGLRQFFAEPGEIDAL